MFKFNGLVVLLSLVLVFGCSKTTRKDQPAPKESEKTKATVIPYVDTEAFDLLFEAALNRQDRIVVITTDTSKPDWKGRLNAWIAAWNNGGKVEKGEKLFSGSVRILESSEKPNESLVQLQLRANIIADELKEIRGEIDRIERVAREVVAWWLDQAVKERRILLLRPYLFSFENDPKTKNYQLVFYK